MSALAVMSHSTSAGDPLASRGRISPAPMVACACCTPRAMTHSPYFQARSAAASLGTARPHTWHTVSATPCARASHAAQPSASWLAGEPSYPATIPFTVQVMANLPASGFLCQHAAPQAAGTGPILLSGQDVRVPGDKVPPGDRAAARLQWIWLRAPRRRISPPLSSGAARWGSELVARASRGLQWRVVRWRGNLAGPLPLRLDEGVADDPGQDDHQRLVDGLVAGGESDPHREQRAG